MSRHRQLRVLLAVTAVWLAWATWYFFSGRGRIDLSVVDETGAPVVGAVISTGGERLAATDAGGQAEVPWSRAATYTIEAPGFVVAEVAVESRPEGPVGVEVRARLLRGVVVDAEALPVPGVYVSSGYGSAVTGDDGRFSVRLAEPGRVRVWRPAWNAGDFDWDGSPGERTIAIAPMVVKAVHVVGEAPGDPTRWDETLRLVEDTELNAVMLDLKDEDGIVYYPTSVETASRAGAVFRDAYDLAAVARAAADAGAYLIGRITTFQDPVAARGLPGMAVTDGRTGRPYENNGQVFLDPTDPEARGYGLSLAAEACSLGVDEIQFDYVRYPDGFGPEAVFDGASDAEGRVETIRSFLQEARDRLHPLGCAVAADIFGFVTTAVDDGGIGQHWESVVSVVDVVSPMVYPSHYADGWYGFDRPVEHPGEMVARALSDGLARLESAVVVRPWLQDFAYTPEQVRSQIEAAEEQGLGWMLWNAAGNVTVEALRPQ